MRHLPVGPAVAAHQGQDSHLLAFAVFGNHLSPYPFTTAMGRVRATFREMPAPWATLTTSFTSL